MLHLKFTQTRTQTLTDADSKFDITTFQRKTKDPLTDLKDINTTTQHETNADRSSHVCISKTGKKRTTGKNSQLQKQQQQQQPRTRSHVFSFKRIKKKKILSYEIIEEKSRLSLRFIS